MSCAYVNTSGEQCQANAMKNSQFCFVHNPETKEKHARAGKKGGHMSKRDKLNLPAVPIKSPSDVVLILEETINGVRSGTIPPQIANTLAYICSHALSAMKDANLDQRVEMIESILLERKMTMRRK